MKPLIATLALFALALPVRASTPVTVAQLEQKLAADRTQPDSKLAGELSGLELTQRLSAPSLARLQSQLPGPRSHQELSILADESSFLDLPPGEIPSTPTPAFAQQRQIMAKVVTYVTQTILKLPDFIATRQTRSFDDRPVGELSYLPLHQTHQFTVSVLYRDGLEVDRTAAGKKAPTPDGLVSWGEFGPILSTVLLDAAHGQLGWSHWELGPDGQVAVFRYAVPASKSQYQLRICGSAPPCSPAPTGYHGEITADPASGAILRLTAIADIARGGNLELYTGLASGSIMVDYGPVDIGGKSYICPVHSVALAQIHRNQLQPGVTGLEALDRSPKQTLLNAAAFTHYHIYRGESRILTDAEAAQMESAPGETTPSAPTATADDSQPAEPAAEPQPAPANAAGSAHSAGPANPPGLASSATSANIPVFRTTARQVLVDVVVDKKNGDPVSGLPQSDFTINEDGQPQTIDFFEEHAANAAAPAMAPAMPPLPPGAVSNVPTASSSGALYILLLDSLNTEPLDQVFVHEQVLSYLRKMDPGTQVAVFSLGSNLRILQGFTSDPALLLAAVSGKEAERDVMAQNRSDDADDAQHISNLQMMQAGAAGIASLRAADANAHNYSFGIRVSLTFEALNALARYLEGIPGRKNLIWFAGSFPVAIFPTPAQIKKNPDLPGYTNNFKQTANLFTLSKIAVYPINAAGVPVLDTLGGGGRNGGASLSQATAEIMNSASDQSGAEQLANSTGGRAFITNDIDAALHKIVHDSAVYYTVGYAPASAVDGRFRSIEVKVTGGKFKLAYRQGYNASESGAAPAENPMAPLLKLGLPNATGILFGARAAVSPHHDSAPAGQNPQLKGPLTRYAVSFTIRAQDVSFGQAPSGERIAKLLVGVKAYGADGAALNWQATREAVEIAPAEYTSMLESGIPVTVDLDLPANTPARLVTAVYDWNATRSGTLEIPVHP